MAIRAIMAGLALLAAGAAAVGGPATAPATAPTTAPAERTWGPQQAGLSISAAPVGDWRIGEPMALALALRNTGRTTVTLPAPEDVFGYLLIGQRQTAYYTQKLFHARGLDRWPARLAGGQVVELPAVDVAALQAARYKRGLLLSKGYPTEMIAGKPVPRPPEGALGELLKMGPAKVRWMLYLDRDREGALLLEGKAARTSVGVSDFGKLPAGVRESLLADLAGRMKKDAWSAKVAHADAVRIGAPAVEVLAEIVGEASAAHFARMWSATALTGIGGEKAVDVLIACLADNSAALRHVAAYHGLKLDSRRFDKALNDKAVRGDRPKLTAWALLGHAQFRGKAPAELVAASVSSDRERVRAAVAEVFARTRPVPAQLPFLHRLAQDPVETIRLTAVTSLGASGDRSAATVDALVRSLQLSGERSRKAAAAVLCKVTGKNWTYPARATDPEREAVVRQWGEWWSKARASYRPRKK